MNFTAYYYDGKTSKAHPAEVELQPNTLKITAAINGETENIFWDIKGIHKSDFGNGRKVVLKYGNFPHQFIEVEHPEFVATLKVVYPKKQFEDSIYSKIFSWGLGGLLLIALGFILLGCSIYFFALPWAAEKAALIVPLSYEKQFGEAVKKSFIADLKVDSNRSELLNSFFKEMKLNTQIPVNITVVKSSEMNAFALPGGEMVVYSKILDKLENYEALAALLGHEYSHIKFRHSTRSLFKSVSGYLFISVLFNDVSGVAAVLIENANAIRNLNYSRTFEKQADLNALEILRNQKINPQGMITLFTQLQNETGSTEKYIPEFMSTHPLTQERLRYIKDEIAKGGFEIEQNKSLATLFNKIKSNSPQ